MRPIQYRLCAAGRIRVCGEGIGPKGTALAAINLRCVDELDLAQMPVTQQDGKSMRHRDDVG